MAAFLVDESLPRIVTRELLAAGHDATDVRDVGLRGAPDEHVFARAIAWRPQDQQDIERLLALHGARMDLARVRRIATELAAALEEPERAAELDRTIERALS